MHASGNGCGGVRNVAVRYESVEALLAAIRARDGLLHGQSVRVAEYAAAIGERLGLSDAEIGRVERGALLHDVGKLGVPEAILRKPGPLDEIEWVAVRRHPEIGAQILGCVSGLAPVALIVRAHHERYDGGGYPDGLAGTRIPLGARIVAVADAFEAMISDRPYRRGMPVKRARAELVRCAGTQFDPGVVDALIELISNQESERMRGPVAGRERVASQAGAQW